MNQTEPSDFTIASFLGGLLSYWFSTSSVLPQGSPHAPAESAGGGEIEIDLEADDPPDLLESDVIDLSGYAVEHLSLDLDPFPRKPGAEFVTPADDADLSPFAVLKAFKPRDDA